MNKPIFTVDQHSDGQRLDNYLRKQRKHVATGQLYKLIRKGQIRINGKRCQAADKLHAGDLVRVPPFMFFQESDQPLDIPSPIIQQVLSAIIAEDNDYVVVNKPAGMAVHKGTGHDYGVIDILQQERSYRNVLLAHRLDVVTSGCLVLAKNRPALLHFQKKLKARLINKTYIALLQGVLSEPRTVRQNLSETRIHGLKTAVIDATGKTAETHIEPQAIKSGKTWALCSPLTGRTHQIRAHCAFLSCPIIGDSQYGATVQPNLARSVFLHAAEVAFGEKLFQAPTPPEFSQFWQNL